MPKEKPKKSLLIQINYKSKKTVYLSCEYFEYTMYVNGQAECEYKVDNNQSYWRNQEKYSHFNIVYKPFLLNVDLIESVFLYDESN